MELNELISSVNDAVWGYVLIAALVSCGLWFTWRTRFVQFRMVGEMIRLLTDSAIDTVETQVKENAAGERSDRYRRSWCRILDVGHRLDRFCDGFRGVDFSAVVQAEA